MPTNLIATPKVYIVRCGREEGIEIGRKAGVESTLISLVKDKLISEKEAAKRLEISAEELRQMLD